MAEIPPNSLFSALAFVGFILAGLPIPWHIHSWHTGTCMYMLWTSLGCLILFVNSVAWNDNVINWAPVWCDISAHYLIGASVGIPASSFCIIRRLYYMTKLETISVKKEEKRREIMVDLLIGIGLPCVVMALQYVVQSHRFTIFEQIGCYPFTINTLAAYFLVYMWPLVIGLMSLVYAVLTFRRAFLQKQQLKAMLHAGFFISAGHYWRLMALCCMEIIFTVPLSLFAIIMNTLGRQVPYVSWAWIHSDFSQIGQYPTALWQSSHTAISLEELRWSYILCAFIIFAFFGWAQEARDFYRQAFWSVCRCLGYSEASRSSLHAIPVHDVDKQLRSKYLPMPAKARVKRDSWRASLSFEAPPRPDSALSSLRISVAEGSVENPQRLPALSGLTRYTNISWESLIAAPEPALSKDRRSQDVGQAI